MTAAPSSAADTTLNALAEEFLTRYRRGERPELTEYTERHPALAERIHELFPTLMLTAGRARAFWTRQYLVVGRTAIPRR